MGCTVGSCRGLSNDGFYRIDSVHPLSHGLWPMTAPPAQGSLFLCSVSPYVDFYRAVIASKRAGRAAAPTRKIDTASRPSSGHFVATFPKGKAFFPPPGNSALSYPKFSAIPRNMHENPPFGGFSFLDSYCIMEEKIQEVRLCPHLLFI